MTQTDAASAIRAEFGVLADGVYFKNDHVIVYNKTNKWKQPLGIAIALVPEHEFAERITNALETFKNGLDLGPPQ